MKINLEYGLWVNVREQIGISANEFERGLEPRVQALDNEDIRFNMKLVFLTLNSFDQVC